jgi:hypothetical protein
MLENFCFAVAGGFAVEILGLWKLRQQAPENLPQWLKSMFYWLCTFAMILTGGVLALVYSYSNVTLTAITAFHVGVTAPLIVASLSEFTPVIEPGRTN